MTTRRRRTPSIRARRRSIIVGIGAATMSCVGLTVLARDASALPTSKIAYVRGAGAESCPDETELRRAVAKRVGYDPFFPFAERTVVALIDRTASEFTGQVRLIDAEGRSLGERKLEAVRDCGELVQNMALAISVAIDDLDQARSPLATPTPAESPTTPASAPAVTEPRPSPAPVGDRSESTHRGPTTEPSTWRMRTSVGATGTIGAAPAFAPGATIGVGAHTNGFWIGAEGHAQLPVGDAIAPRGRVVTSLLAASLVPCVFLRTRPRPYLCAVGSIGSLSARAEEVSLPREASNLWLSLGGRIGLEIPLRDRLALYAQVEGAGTLTRHRLELDSQEVYRLPGASVSAGIGLSVLLF